MTSYSDDRRAFHDSAGATLSALVRCRESVLQRATTLMSARGDIPPTEQFDVLPSVSALLMTSLEELKVAEEELREQNTLLFAQRADVDDRVNHYRQLFLHAPIAAFVTDTFGAIQEVNHAASQLFRRQANHLEGKPLDVLVASESRDAFRRKFARLSVTDGADDWRILFHRLGDVPVQVSAAVQLVPGVGRTGSGALYWMLRVIDSND